MFVFAFGACVGSFVNVVAHRLPKGMSVISPPSSCPTCGARLRFFRENLPILGWFLVRGRCRYCGVRVSPQYMVVELVMALFFAGLYAVLFMSGATPWLSQVGGIWWEVNGFFGATPAFFAMAFLFAGLLAMTLIDARTFTIPIKIPLFVTFAAFAFWPIQAVWWRVRSPAPMTWPIPGASGMMCLAAAGGMAGVVIGLALLWSGRLRYSFADYEEYATEGAPIADYPHARREMLVEMIYLLPAVVGFFGGMIAGALGGLAQSAPAPLVQALGASFLGYLSGAAVVWAVRILGSFAFGREAMGLGDVHLMACVGAVLGWLDPILIFFIAPFFGLLWAIWSIGLSALFRRARRELPYGPHLAVATLVVVFARPAIERGWAVLMPNVPIPQPGFFP